MDIGVSLSSTYPDTPPRDAVRALIERARVAREVGLDHLTVGDHHATSYPYVQNVPILARLLAEWGDRPAGCLFLFPLWSPLLVAEQVGTLAALADGPFIVQTGVGSGEDQFGAMGASLTSRGATTEEGIGLVQQMLSGQTVSSQRFGLTGARVGLRPPTPVEWWIGASADVGIDRAARLGDTWYVDPRDAVPGGLTARVAHYRRRCTAAGKPAGGVAVRQDVFVAETDEAAWRVMGPVLDAGYRGMTRDHVGIGSVETVAERFAGLAGEGATAIVVRQIATDQRLALRSLELVGEVRRQLGG